MNESLGLLKEAIPHKNMDSIINILYKTIVKRDEDGNRRSAEQLSRIAEQGDLRDEGRGSSFHICDSNIRALGCIEGELLYHYDPRDSKGPSQEEAGRWRQKRIIAECVIKKQYGVQAYTQEVQSRKLESDL